MRYLCAMLLGYARVSADNQDTAAQVAALKAAGCERMYRDQGRAGMLPGRTGALADADQSSTTIKLAK